MNRSSIPLFLTISILLSGCLPASASPQSENVTPSPIVQSLSTVTPHPNTQPGQGANEDFVGRVIDENGIPIQGASVESVNNTTISETDGWFRFPSEGLPQWIKVTSPGFISRTRAAAPGIPVLFRLTPDDGETMVLHFAGDTMFGRRFFDPNEDDYTADGLLPLDPTVEDHLRLLAPITPLLENADFTVLNLETTFSHQPYFRQKEVRPLAFHPTANYVYASSPNAVRALKQSGVDIVDIGNNHSYDMMEVGLSTSLSTLDQSGVLHFGAGTNEANAWAPVIITSKRQTVAFLGCTTLRIPLNTPTRNDVPFVASDVLQKGGAAYCTETTLRSAVSDAKQRADAVVVMIHGGKEYDRNPTSKITYLTAIARQAGATLVINHQPHVVGGLSFDNQSLVAWTMGNFFSDQTVWPSFESYMLAVYLREGKIVRAYVEPLIIDDFVPHGLTGELADYVIRGAAGRKAGPFIMENGAMEVDLNGRALQHTYTQTMVSSSRSGEIIHIPQAKWISDFKGTGNLLLGRDLLWVGGFENDEVDSASRGAPLWDLNLGGVQIGQDYAYEGEIGIHLTRGADKIEDAVTTNLHRVLVVPTTNLSITGMIRINQGVEVSAQLSWYRGTVGLSFVKMTQPIEIQEYGTWQPFRIDAQVPPRAMALGLYLRLTPPDKGTATADFDNIRIIEWARPGTPYSPLYNYALLNGTGDLTFAQEILPGAEQWLAGPHVVDQNK